MGRRGPPPTPTAILSTRGSWRAKVRAAEPDSGGTTGLTCPKWLREEAKRIWKQLVPGLAAQGIVGWKDRIALARYCETLAKYLKAAEFLQRQKEEVYAVTDKGGTVHLIEYPQVERVERYNATLMRMEQQFGLTPASRAALAQPAEKTGKQETIGLAAFKLA